MISCHSYPPQPVLAVRCRAPPATATVMQTWTTTCVPLCGPTNAPSSLPQNPSTPIRHPLSTDTIRTTPTLLAHSPRALIHYFLLVYCNMSTRSHSPLPTPMRYQQRRATRHHPQQHLHYPQPPTLTLPAHRRPRPLLPPHRWCPTHSHKSFSSCSPRPSLPLMAAAAHRSQAYRSNSAFQTAPCQCPSATSPSLSSRTVVAVAAVAAVRCVGSAIGASVSVLPGRWWMRAWPRTCHTRGTRALQVVRIHFSRQHVCDLLSHRCWTAGTSIRRLQ